MTITTSTLTTSTVSSVTLSTQTTFSTATSTTRTFTAFLVLQTAEPIRSPVWVTIALVVLVGVLLATMLYLWRKNKLLQRLPAQGFAVHNLAYTVQNTPKNTENTTNKQTSENMNTEIVMYEEPQTSDNNYVPTYSSIPDAKDTGKTPATPEKNDNESADFGEPTYDTVGEEESYVEMDNKSQDYFEMYTDASYVTIAESNPRGANDNVNEHDEAIYV
eukprot:m.273313 g.273313  ORF g.273313 m.273313 type:complete len:218 (-) comp16279_c1_seq6:85-738(-)